VSLVSFGDLEGVILSIENPLLAKWAAHFPQ
jgi:hypothetical protein